MFSSPWFHQRHIAHRNTALIPCASSSQWLCLSTYSLKQRVIIQSIVPTSTSLLRHHSNHMMSSTRDCSHTLSISYICHIPILYPISIPSSFLSLYTLLYLYPYPYLYSLPCLLSFPYSTSLSYVLFISYPSPMSLLYLPSFSLSRSFSPQWCFFFDDSSDVSSPGGRMMKRTSFSRW